MPKIMPVKEAVRRLKKIGTDTALEIAGWIEEENERFEDSKVRWYDGDVDTDEPFLVPEIVVVNGDLKTSKTLFDCEEAEESLLGVLGNVSVDNMISFGRIIIEKDLTASGLVYGDSLSDLFLDVKGVITAPVVLETGHSIEGADIRADIVISAQNHIAAKENPDLTVFDTSWHHPALHKLLSAAVFDEDGDVDRILVNEEAKRSGRILVSTEKSHISEVVGLLKETRVTEENADKTDSEPPADFDLKSLLSRASQAKEKLSSGDVQTVYEFTLAAFQRLQQGDFKSAVAIYEVLIPHKLKDLSIYCNALYAIQLCNSGRDVDPDRHRRFLDACLPYGSENPSILSNAACLYVQLGEPDKVFEMLEASLKLGHTHFLNFESEPMFKDLLAEPRFQRLFAQAKKGGEEEETTEDQDETEEIDSPETRAEILQELQENGNPYSFFDLVDFPNECPWHNGETDLKLFLEKLYQPFQKDLPRLTSYLIDNCTGVYSLKLGTNWWLIYDLGQKGECFVGGAPNTAPKLSAEAEGLGWHLPSELKNFAQLHDGFGVADPYSIACLNDSLPEWEFVLPANRLMTPSEFWSEEYFQELYQEQLEEWEGCTPDEWEEYHLKDFLFFLIIGTGDGVGFVRNSERDADYKTVAWWHDDAQGGPVSFFAFLEERFTDEV